MTILDQPQYRFESTQRYQTWATFREETFANQLGKFKDKPVRFLEIGSFEGASAVWSLTNVLTHPDSEIHLVDCQGDSRMQILRDNLEATGKASQAQIHCLDSKDIRRYFQDNSFHFVYVDAAHEARAVLRDVMDGYLLCKIGGLVGCDDYRIDTPQSDGTFPLEAIDAFTSIYRESIKVTHDDYQLWFQRLS